MGGVLVSVDQKLKRVEEPEGHPAWLYIATHQRDATQMTSLVLPRSPIGLDGEACHFNGSKVYKPQRKMR